VAQGRAATAGDINRRGMYCRLLTKVQGSEIVLLHSYLKRKTMPKRRDHAHLGNSWNYWPVNSTRMPRCDWSV